MPNCNNNDSKKTLSVILQHWNTQKKHTNINFAIIHSAMFDRDSILVVIPLAERDGVLLASMSNWVGLAWTGEEAWEVPTNTRSKANHAQTIYITTHLINLYTVNGACMQYYN